MDLNEIRRISEQLLSEHPLNQINKQINAYQPPVIAVASAEDALFETLCGNDVIGGHFRKPKEWLPKANSVVSIFFPITEEVKQSNSRQKDIPSDEWLYARYEGQKMIDEITQSLAEKLRRGGAKVVIPGLNEDFRSAGPVDKGFGTFTSNWSERHVAFIAGHGTFGLSKGLITTYGIAGRFSSLITDLALPPNEREYTELYEYCNECGACIANCPVQAISFEQGKEHLPCSDYLDRMLQIYEPRYACGKCQCGVPCESGKP